MALETSYSPRSAGSLVPSGEQQPAGESYWPLTKLKKAYTDYLFSKREEIDEQIEARRYYGCSQWTSAQIETLKKRNQPIMTFNRTARKIDGVVGLVERLRQQPKAYARTPQHEEGAELMTAVLRYTLDSQEWKTKSPLAALSAAVEGIGGISLELEDGDKGDKEIGIELVDTASFFYDPRSVKLDFSDARYMGLGKWLDEDVAREMFPDASEDAFSADDELVSNTDKDSRWFSTDGVNRRVRVVDEWYQHKGGWCWAIFSGNAVLMEGKSYLKDEKKKDACKYIMFSANVDQDGDRYGFHRNMKSAQDGLNAKQSKMQHMIASKRLFIRKGAVQDVEVTRREYGRPDGVVETIGNVNETVKADDQTNDFMGLAKLLELNLAEIENFGPNPALIGQGIENKSGRAIALLQQAGIAELGPFILSYRGWKLRTYRGIGNGVQQHWTAERWIRVTDDDGLAQFLQVNQLAIDPQTGQPTIVNALGSLDVDIILDEGPDSMTLSQDTFEAFGNVVQSIGPMLSPPEARAVVNIMIEASNVSPSAKKQFREAGQQPNPMQEIQVAGAQEEVKNTAADTQLKQAQAMKAMSDAEVAPLEALMNGQMPQGQPQEYEVPPELQNMQAMADIEETRANTQHKQAQAFKTQQEGVLAPRQMMMDAANAAEDRKVAVQQARQRATQAQR